MGIIVATTAAAAPRHVTGKAIGDLVAGAVIEIDTPLGTRLPVTYAENGELSGRSPGDLARHLGSATDTGKWWVAADQLCHKWSRWFDGETQCLRLKLDRSTIHWRHRDGTTGTATVIARIASAKPKPFEPQATPRPLAFVGASALGIEVAESKSIETPEQLAEPAPTLPDDPAATEAPAEPPADPQIAEGTNASAPPRDVAKAPPPPPAPAGSKPKPAAAPKVLVMNVANVRQWDVLNVRQGPSPEHAIVGAIAPDARGVAVTAPCQDRWCPISHKGLSGWVNSFYLSGNGSLAADDASSRGLARYERDGARIVDAPDAPRSCLTADARALLARIEQQFGPVRLVSTCRPGARIAGTGRLSRHASGNAIDFDAGARKTAVIEWLLANHNAGGIMTYAGMDHIHVDIGPRFVSLTGGRLARR